jgi:hypothetical protein
MKPTAAAVAVAVVAVGACGRADRPAAPTAVEVAAPSVRSVTVQVGERRVRFTQDGQRVWHATEGASGEAAALLLAAEDRLFPLRGYRLVEHPGDDPQFGLNPPAATFTVSSGEGETSVAIGAATFNGGGYYARVAGRPGDLFLLPRSILADLQSLVEGRPVAPPQPEDERIARALAGGDGPPDDGSENPWVRQALESGATLPSGQR